MKDHSRRTFLRTSALGLAAAGTLPACGAKSQSQAPLNKTEVPFELGIASYTFRKFSLEETLAMTVRLAVRNIAFKSFHLPLDSTPEQIEAAVVKVKEAGLNLYGCGVVYMNNENEVNNAFEYARLGGMKVIIGVPGHDLLPLVEKKGQKLARAEEKLRGHAVQTAQLMAKYGKAAAVALSARKIRTSDVAGVLEKGSKLGDRFYELVLEAERKALSKRFR